MSRAWGHPPAPRRGQPTPGPQTLEMRLGASVVPAPLLSGLGVTEGWAVTLASCLQVIWNPRLSRVFST